MWRTNAGGATDAKLTSLGLLRNQTVLAVSGPTSDQQPVFDWTTTPLADCPHRGQPLRFDFAWQSFQLQL
jgi:hypothetical protein